VRRHSVSRPIGVNSGAISAARPQSVAIFEFIDENGGGPGGGYESASRRREKRLSARVNHTAERADTPIMPTGADAAPSAGTRLLFGAVFLSFSCAISRNAPKATCRGCRRHRQRPAPQPAKHTRSIGRAVEIRAQMQGQAAAAPRQHGLGGECLGQAHGAFQGMSGGRAAHRQITSPVILGVDS
jgi:hypothetical protein